MTLHEGDMFGERALIKKEARQANIIAAGPVECYYLESQDFYAMLGTCTCDHVLWRLINCVRIFRLCVRRFAQMHFQHLHN